MESLTLRASPSTASPLLRLPGRRRAASFRVSASSGAGEPDLSVTVNGLKMPNPFVIGSGPPGTNYTVMKRAFDEGWGGVIAKTVSLDAGKVINVTPRYARLRADPNGATKSPIIGWQNIELISDRPLETMLNEFKQLKKEYPDRILIGSIMEEYNKAAWHELIERVEESGVDALEINFSCPHGMPERKMGAAVGQDCALLEEVSGWINEKATVPVWSKMTPNITDITEPSRIALKSGSEGIAAINTIMSVMGIDLKTLRPEPCVEGYSTPGGYSARAVHPIALAKVMQIARLIKEEFPEGRSLSAIGGVETGNDAAEFILLGADPVQLDFSFMPAAQWVGSSSTSSTTLPLLTSIKRILERHRRTLLPSILPMEGLLIYVGAASTTPECTQCANSILYREHDLPLHVSLDFTNGWSGCKFYHKKVWS